MGRPVKIPGLEVRRSQRRMARQERGHIGLWPLTRHLTPLSGLKFFDQIRLITLYELALEAIYSIVMRIGQCTANLGLIPTY